MKLLKPIGRLRPPSLRIKKEAKPKILFVTSEEAPFAKVGGLGEVMFSLPRALARLGYDTRVLLPFYGSIDRSAYHPAYVYEGLEVPTDPENEGKRIICNVRKLDKTGDPRSPVPTYFLENQEYYELRANVYGYGDDRIRFALLARGCLEFLNVSHEWMPDIIVCTDWMAGYLPNFLKTDYREYQRLKNMAAVFSIHNLASQGTVHSHRFLTESEKDDGQGPIPDFFGERMSFINPVRRGIIYSDLVITVSPTYAKEITTDEFGEGLGELLSERRGRLFGVLNGIDYETNNPATDPYLAKNFSLKNITPRIENKLALQKRFGLPADKNIFAIGIVSRLVRQKGFDLLTPILPAFLRATNCQLVILGSGDTDLMTTFQNFEKEFPDQVRTHLRFDDELPHLIYAGCDAILVPSKFEPSGLIQMEAMRYGAVPVARRIGGLADTIEDYSPGGERGTGFIFDDFDANALLIAMTRTFTAWRHRASWTSLQKRVLGKDFSWEHSAREYGQLFHQAMHIHLSESEKSKTNHNPTQNRQ